ncbi:glucosamine-6-phosphate deaminase [Candidatus Bipolaricaulota bacterium]|nr:glucosamine-6-phosphate deaminase [Candidatus Bipolaricaulota bacterium]
MVSVEVESNYEEMSKKAAREVGKEILMHQAPVLGLPTGETPKGMYRLLVKYYEHGLVDFSNVTTFNLDEYYGISKDHPKSFNHYMKRHLFERVNLREENFHVPEGEIPRRDVRDYCGKYENKIKQAGGIDLQLLGIGTNGHIGFNEPGTGFDTRTRLVELAEETLEYSFDNLNEAPDKAITMGINTIMEASKIVLLASDNRKKRAVRRALEGPITEEWPGSVLQLHPDVTAILDEKAAEDLELSRVNLTG